MFDFHEKRKLKKYAYSWPTAIVLLIVAVFLGNSVWGVYLKERETSEKLEQREAYLDEISGRGYALEKEIDRLSDERGLEEELRSKFEIAKEGEKVIVIVNAPESIVEDVVEKKGIFRGILDFFTFWD